MRIGRSLERLAFVGVTWTLLLLAPGCGSSTAKVPGPLKNLDAIGAALPQGVSLDSPIIPDARYGFCKTVGEALTSLQATVDGQTIHEGFNGQEIRFEHGGKSAKSNKSSKKQPAVKSPDTVIMLAD